MVAVSPIEENGSRLANLADRFFPPFLIGVVGWLCYSGSLQGGFQFDDYSSIVENPAIRNPWDFSTLFLFAKTRFVTYFTFALQRHLHGLQPFPFILLNVLIHLAAALTLYAFLRLLFSTPQLRQTPLAPHGRNIALGASLLFVCHPIETQAVAYIVQRATSMATLFYLLCLLLFTQARLRYEQDRRPHVPLYGGALLFAVLAMFTKEISFTLPLCVLLVEVAFFSPSPARLRKQIPHLWPMLLTLFVIPLTYLLTLRGVIAHIGLAAETRNISRLEYLLTQFNVVRTYLRLLFLPIHQSVDYDYPIARSLLEPATFASFLLLLGLLLLALFLFRNQRALSFGILWFFLTLPVESGLIPIRDVIFEHRAYLPSIGILFSSTVLLFQLLHRLPRTAFALFAALVCLLSLATIQRTVIWSRQVLLWHDALKRAPDKIRPFLNRGVGYDMVNEKGLALEDFNRVLSRTQSDPLAFVNRGLLYMQKTEYESAVSDFSRALSLSPGLAKAYANRAISFLMMKRYPEALRDFQAASAIEPHEPFHVNGMGTVCLELKRYDRALHHFTRATELDEKYFAPYLNRGKTLRRLGDTAGALADLDRAIVLEAGLPEIFLNRGLVYVDLKQYKKAIEDFTRAVTLNPSYAEAYSNRAMAYLRLGLPSRALLDLDRAVGLKPQIPRLYRNRRQVLLALGREDAARLDAELAEEIENRFSQETD